MNHKIYVCFFIATIVLCNNQLTLSARNPLDVLGLDEDATDSDIKKKCRKLQTQFHTDKGGDTAKSTEINNACDDLDWRNKDDCKINNKSKYSSCDCLTGTRSQSHCIQGFTNSSIRCDCPLSDGSNQNDYANQFQGTKKNSSSSSSSNQQSGSSTKYSNHDACFFESQPCACSNSGQSGTCNYGPLKTGLYCQCTQQQGQQSTSSSSSGHSYNQQQSSSSSNSKSQNQFEDECKNDSANDHKNCTCPNGNKGTCNLDWSDFKHRCQCSNDECENNSANWGNPCHCSDSGKEGKCRFGTMKDGDLGCRCECEDQQTRSSYSTNNTQSKDSSFTFEPIKIYFLPIYSLNIAAPIYNLPLKQTMAPATDCPGWLFSVTPYTQVNSAKILSPLSEDFLRDLTIKNTEGGLLFNLGYYGRHWYIYDIFSLASSTISSSSIIDTSLVNHGTRLGTLDGLIALGFKTDSSKNDDWKLSLEGFFGVSEQRSKSINEKSPVSIFPDIGTGFQANFDYVVASDYASKYELITLSRFTYFIPLEGEMRESTNQITKVGSIHYSAGAFLDLFIGLKQYYGFDYQHQIECGYNPTLHVISESINAKLDTEKNTLLTFGASIPNIRHTIYATYTYNWNIEKMPMNISVGGSATFAPHTNIYGTFFATYSLGF